MQRVAQPEIVLPPLFCRSSVLLFETPQRGSDDAEGGQLDAFFGQAFGLDAGVARGQLAVAVDDAPPG